jgi:surface protein
MKRDLSGEYTATLDANPDGSNPPRYVHTKSTDFDASGDYTGTEEYIILPADKPSGYQIVNPIVKGVATNGDYLTSCQNMFRDNPSSYLELDYLDTSNVTNMRNMFNGSHATTLDLSSFDTSNVTYMSNMFYNAQATTGYARTQADADRFNNSEGKPETLTFVVKPPA